MKVALFLRFPQSVHKLLRHMSVEKDRGGKKGKERERWWNSHGVVQYPGCWKILGADECVCCKDECWPWNANVKSDRLCMVCPNNLQGHDSHEHCLFSRDFALIKNCVNMYSLRDVYNCWQVFSEEGEGKVAKKRAKRINKESLKYANSDSSGALNPSSPAPHKIIERPSMTGQTYTNTSF